MAITRPVPAPALFHQPLKAMRRWFNTAATTTRRKRHTPSRPTLRSSLGPPAAISPPAVWQLDRSELTSALEHSRW